MKKILFLILLCASLSLSCNSNKDDNNQNVPIVTMDTVYDSSPVANGDDSLLYVKNQSLLWHVKDSVGLTLQKPVVTGIDTMSTENILNLINDNYDSINVEYVKTSHDTIYVHIPDSEMLTERIGSTGAQIFMASTTYSLTEMKGIRYVNFDFVEGDHAAPGVYDRSYFKNMK